MNLGPSGNENTITPDSRVPGVGSPIATNHSVSSRLSGFIPPRTILGSPADARTSTDGDVKQSSAFERWRRQAMLVTGIGVSEEERMQHLREFQTRQCEKTKAYLMEYSPVVVFMMKQLKQAGCDVPQENIFCAPCDNLTRAGGYSPERGAVVLCSGQFFSQNHMETTLAHELIHMFDQCRFKVDWSNLRHHACSEIRANSLSGDCKYTRELRRGFTSFSKQHQACVRRRAIVSVAANAACPDEATAERVVNEVWDSCFADTRPFDEVHDIENAGVKDDTNISTIGGPERRRK